jgi:hypothetical protein
MCFETRWLKPTAIKENSTVFLFIAVSFMGRIEDLKIGL